MDEIDRDAPETAIREAHEEIGLLPDSLKVASIHEPGVSLHRLLVAPVSAFIDLSLLEFAVVNPSVSIAANLVRHLPVNPDEVESVFAIPLQEFLKRENHEELHFDADDGSGGVWKAHKFDVVDEWGREYKVWGLTAHILVEFARIALGRDPEFPLISNAQRPKILNRADRSTRRG
ncbi:hypothetical protein BDR26DRAFT_865140 [Obelidium mucronatum]|nr:hypothetical protein BDR26DRAFT_865140 [Obelidium mucronatum]